MTGKHRLWLTLDTQHVLEVDDHDHAKQSLVEFDSEFEVHHAVTDPATGKICLYFTDKAHMNQAAVRVKARKIENLAMHVNSSCEYPYCHSARMKALAARNARDGKKVFWSSKKSQHPYRLVLTVETQHLLSRSDAHEVSIKEFEAFNVAAADTDPKTKKLWIYFNEQGRLRDER